jgi:serine/threonine protein kinase
MMLIGRHKNVVHLFEVLEYIQEAKSTMFLILELVRGGELFDLISSNSARISNTDTIPRGFTENETVMRKFFRELASGVHYCHMNGIAHRDLKPENLLVHNSRTGACTLKIADFGLSAAFGPNSAMQTDADTVVESLAPDGSYATMSRKESDADGTLATAPAFPLQPQPSPIKERMDKLLTVGGSALSFLTCGVVEDMINCRPGGATVELEAGPSPLKRMTSVVGSPHYVAPEIISQSDAKRNKKPDGYDGTRADVWSIGVICYAVSKQIRFAISAREASALTFLTFFIVSCFPFLDAVPIAAVWRGPSAVSEVPVVQEVVRRS